MANEPVFVAEVDRSGVFLVSGDVDVMSIATLSRALVQALHHTGGPLVVDLSGVEFIDAAGVGGLVEVANRASAVGRALAIRDPSAAVRRMMSILGPDWPLTTV